MDQVCWMDFEACKRAVEENTIKHCIALEELQMIEPQLSARVFPVAESCDS